MTLLPSEPIPRHLLCTDCAIELGQYGIYSGFHICLPCANARALTQKLNFTPAPSGATLAPPCNLP